MNNSDNIFLKISSANKSFEDSEADKKTAKKFEVIKNLSLELPSNSFTTIFGPNGSGKSTLLNILSGILTFDSGSLITSNEQYSVGYVFQDFRATLFPWKKAIDNIAYPLELRGIDKKTRRKKALEILERFSIDIPYMNYPYQLSGGQQQLTSISRALINDPKLLLLDEPFSALDYETRFFMHKKIQEIWTELKSTILFVSHELDEAIYLADYVVFFSKRPATVIQRLDVKLSRPRLPVMMEEEEFFKLKSEGLKIFRRALNEKI